MAKQAFKKGDRVEIETAFGWSNSMPAGYGNKVWKVTGIFNDGNLLELDGYHMVVSREARATK